MTSHLLYKTRCPRCAENGRDRSGDNLGVYSDGHSYCYSCGYTTNATSSSKLRQQAKQELKEIPALPEDVSNKIGRIAYEWLLQYFSPENFPRCLWSVSERKLYFMLEGGAYQYRYFGDNPKHPKWVSYGINENLIHIVSSRMELSNSRCLVLVEDIISAMKVGHHIPTLCLFGSNISLKRLATLKLLGYSKIIIWLDWDKKEYAIKAAQLAQSIGLQTRVIHTKLDPKDYDHETIKLALEGNSIP